MSKIIARNLIKINNQTWLKSINNSLYCQLYSRTLSTIKNPNDRLLLSCPTKLNQISIRLTETDKSNQTTEQQENKKANNERFQAIPKGNKQFVFSWRALGVSSLIAGLYFGFIYYFKKEKEKQWEMERQKTLGKGAIGGEFNLVDVNKKPVSNKDFLGKWVLIYFGFTHCPDVCPEEIEKMVDVYHRVKKQNKKDEIVPLFISVDPDRDTPEIVKKYCEEFSPEIIGLTGNREQVKAMCKNYRVYYSAGPKTADKDYIVDHTIIMYLINPDGEFVDYYGQTRNAEMISNAILINMKKFKNLKSGASSWFGL